MRLASRPHHAGPRAAAHAFRQWLRAAFSLPLAKNDPQGPAAATPHARRYALAAIAGVVADDDDDGNAASQPTRQPASYSPQQARARPGTAEPAGPPRSGAAARRPAAVDGMTVEQASSGSLAVRRVRGTTPGIPRPTTVAGWVSAGRRSASGRSRPTWTGPTPRSLRNGAAGVR